MQDLKRIIIVGATSAIAEHCARLWVSATNNYLEIVLIGRNALRLECIAQDLKVRNSKITVITHITEFNDEKNIQLLVRQLWEDGPADLVLIAHGTLPNQLDCQNNLALCRVTLEINGVSPLLFAEAFAKQLEKTNHGTLAIIGSVAGDRGRKSNYVYGAAKGLIERYVQGLQHRFANTNVKIVLIKPGPTETPMTTHLKQKTRLADVQTVAQFIVNGISKGKAVIYTPPKWALIMLIIRHLPRFIFNKLDI